MPSDPQTPPSLINTPPAPTPEGTTPPQEPVGATGAAAPAGATGAAGETGAAGATGATGDGKPDPNLVTKDNPFKAEEVKFPDGTQVDQAMVSSFVDVVNEFGLPRTAVAKLLDLQQKAMLANSEAGSRDWAKMQETWTGEVMKDPEIGGQNWPQVQTKIGGLLDTFGSPELRQAFDLTGAGNNPHVVRFMSKVANILSESGYISSNASGATEKSAAEILYPNQGKK